MVWVAGADGCRFGWFVVSRETRTGELSFDMVGCARELPGVRRDLRILALDIPIGLPTAGRRACDEAARARLGWPRRNSVFPAPVRPALRAESRDEASRITRNCDGRGVGAQAWGIYKKIYEVDELLQSDPSARRMIREAHPEVSFCLWNGGRPLTAGKKTRQGRAARLSLAEDWLGEGILARARGDLLKRQVADDDILDAIAALWTAERIAAGIHENMPPDPPRDETGLPMQIVC